ncbi:MAG: family 78 glycoside hydrolase catalytic domain, partial [Oscillospiraceae bacterium]|nr:family 78 glycoside hydrolase catalytic domain [Oscillospiraceae bacterium]
MKILNLRTNGTVCPLGFELGRPSLSWTVEDARARRQLSARVEIARAGETVYDSGERTDIYSLGFRPELELSPRTRYDWRVSVTGDNGERGVSEWSFFETALGRDEWSAEWISPDTENVLPVMLGMLTLDEEPQSARIYASGLGLYRLAVNGAPASDELFAPGFNGYDSWVQYQTYDVTPLLKKGLNRIEISLGNGIAKGRFARAAADEYNYCPFYACICQTHVKMKNGEERVFRSGEDWRWRPSKLRESSIYDGEVFDAAAPEEAPRPVVIRIPPVGPLKARLSPPVRIKQLLAPAAVITTPAGETVLDMGQNMTGWVRFRAKAPKGRRLSLYYGEILQNGCFYRENLRSAKAEYHYISDGTETEAEPTFTYYGFRYVKLEGFDAPRAEDFTGCVIYSDLERTGYIRTSDERINRLFENSLWSQKSNFLDVPTDCPQRDERLGWTGDAQVFSGTACFNMNCRAFFMKYLTDMRFEQRKNSGRVPHVVPDAKGRRSPAEG